MKSPRVLVARRIWRILVADENRSASRHAARFADGIRPRNFEQAAQKRISGNKITVSVAARHNCHRQHSPAAFKGGLGVGAVPANRVRILSTRPKPKLFRAEICHSGRAEFGENRRCFPCCTGDADSFAIPPFAGCAQRHLRCLGADGQTRHYGGLCAPRGIPNFQIRAGLSLAAGQGEQ